MQSAFALLQTYLTGGATPRLLVADENIDASDIASAATGTQVLSNRFELAEAGKNAGLDSCFNDFDFSDYAEAQFALIGYRLSKERPVVEHILAECARLLKPGGTLVLSGGKREGIKRYASIAGTRLAGTPLIRKHGNWYVAQIEKTGDQQLTPGGASTYREPLTITVDEKTTLYSKAGLFGATKIDPGSAMLAEYLPVFFRHFDHHSASALDLGCGYGYLTLFAARAGFSRIIATDNCAAAIEMCRRNVDTLGIDAQVVADDCARRIAQTFDAVLCNPPFHRGFKADTQLIERFVATAAARLENRGRALFIVNEFIALERAAQGYFATVEVVRREQGFKLVELAAKKNR